MVDEEQKNGFLYVIVRVRCPARSREAPFVTAGAELYKFVGYGTSVDLSDAVNCASI